MSRYVVIQRLIIFVAILFVISNLTIAQDETRDLAKELANPISSLISVPIQWTHDMRYGPNDDGSLWQLNFLPVIPFSLGEDWDLIARTIIPLINQDGIPIEGQGESGIGDILQSFFFSPSAVPESGWIWGVGPIMSLPTAPDAALGTEKWAVGPSVVVLKQKGPWTVGVLVNHLWSIAGNENRDEISSTYAEPWLSHVIGGKTTISVSAESTYDWKNDESWVPVNLIVDRLPVAIGGAVRYWLASPENGPEGFGFRLQVTFLFPK